VLRRHATELYDLEPDERARVMDEVSNVARALKLAFDARKVNYALFGNLMPHMHWHLIPRLASDPAPREPVFAVSHDPVGLASEERANRINQIRSRLGR
jgi:diadenosine tetraphosphate (Ap4A) HIT family hydrolase